MSVCSFSSSSSSSLAKLWIVHGIVAGAAIAAGLGARAYLGVLFMHCHLEVHTSWGLKMAWVVLDGKLPNEKLLPPPADLPAF
ncbi:hypothetical protein GH714_025423 [Hevea brasiliensis]|uniref:Plastocyanin-like domain-containing protein n=1 Tax=Hevea brasiliensis TaxID=3981 RepID=A0A6A6MQY7_HEVBR|nr:hypothetical protein GH714_025423 [Hevea brasiliensis]